MSSSEDTSAEPNHFNVDAGPVQSELQVSGKVTVTVTRADNIEVEDSQTQKVLRLRNGDFSVFKTVYLVVHGQRTEITMPVESP